MGVSNQGILKCVPMLHELLRLFLWQREDYTFRVYGSLHTTYSCIFDGSVATIHWDPSATELVRFRSKVSLPLKRALLNTITPPPSNNNPKAPPKKFLGPPGRPPPALLCAEPRVCWSFLNTSLGSCPILNSTVALRNAEDVTERKMDD